MRSPLGLIERVVLVILAGTILRSGPASALDIYVAADGHDAWSGRFTVPDAGGKDGPFATLERARDEIRKLKRGNGLLEPVTVHVRAGTYFLERLKAIRSPRIREIRGLGLMVGIEMKEKAGGVAQAMMREGILVLLAGSTVLRFLPPLVISREDLGMVAATLERVLASDVVARDE